MKVYEKWLEDEAAERAEVERIEKRRAKLAKYKKRRNERLEREETRRLLAEREEMIEIQKEAYIRAIHEIQKESEVA